MTVTPLAPTPGFLPAPRPLLRPHDLPDVDTVAELAGAEPAEPLARIDAAFTRAEVAVRALHDDRPGGARFNVTLADDVADSVSGRTVKRLRIDALVDGDRARWAEAHVACRAAVDIARAARAELDNAAIGKAARTAADQAAADWQAAAAAGWSGRADKATAWQHYRDGEHALGRYITTLRLWEWATGAPRPAPIATREVRVPDITTLPPGPMARGCWLALGLDLEPTVWLHLPNDVQWPDNDAETLVLRAIPEDARRYIALRERGHQAATR